MPGSEPMPDTCPGARPRDHVHGDEESPRRMGGRCVKRFARFMLAASAVIVSCATLQTGILAGRWLRSGQPPVRIVIGWESKSATHEVGDLMVTLPSGERYHGAYVRVVDGVKLESRMSVYNAWNLANAWPMGVGMGYYGLPGDWGAWGPEITPNFASFERNYTGKVIGGLSSAEGHAIRCKFRVNDPQQGLVSGGTGACQVSLGGHFLMHF